MKKISGMISTCMIVAAFSFLLVIFFSNHAMGAGAQVIMIYSSASPEEPVSIQPQDVWIHPNTTVIWNNWTDVKASISFSEGDTCKVATMGSSGFEYDSKKGCFATVREIGKGDTASMTFKSTGRFEYTVELEGKKMKANGVILVRHP